MTWRRIPARLAGSPFLLWALRVRGAAAALLGVYAGFLMLALAAPVGVALLKPSPLFTPAAACRLGTQLAFTFHTLGLVLMGMSRVLGAFARERTQKTLPGLLLTPLHPLEILVGKWVAEVWTLLAASALLILGTFVAALGAGIPLLDWAGTWAALLASAAFLQAASLWVALLYRRPEQAQGLLVAVLIVVWLAGTPVLLLASRGSRLPWPMDAFWLTPVPALQIVWGGSRLAMMGNLSYVLGAGWGMAGALLCLLAASRKLYDPDRAPFPRRLLLILSALAGLYVGLRVWGNQPKDWRWSGAAAILAWGLAAAFALTPSRRALEAGAWRKRQGWLEERSPGRRALAACLLIPLTVLTILYRTDGQTTGVVIPELSWLAAALGVLAFGEVLALCRLLFPRRGTAAALAALILGNALPAAAVGLATRDGYRDYWFALWGVFLDLKPADQTKGVLAFGLLALAFGAIARWQERMLAQDVGARREALLTQPA